MSLAVVPAGGVPFEDDLHRTGHLEPDLAEGPGGGDVLVAHALAEGADRAQDVGVGVGRDERAAGPDQALLDGDVGADPGVDVEEVDAALPGEEPAELLVGGVLLVGAAGVAVEGEEGLGGVVDGAGGAPRGS